MSQLRSLEVHHVEKDPAILARSWRVSMVGKDPSFGPGWCQNW